MADPTPTITATSCLGSTCLQWRSDGELSWPDRAFVLERLARVDPGVAALRQGAEEASHPCTRADRC